MKRIAVVGGGASGMMAAIEAAKGGASVTLFEKKEQLGKKLSATGNGHCNFTNRSMSAAFYRSHELSFIEQFLKDCPTERVLRSFSELGLLYTEKNGYYYPASGQARSVLSVLSEELKLRGVTICSDRDVTGLRRRKSGGFLLLSGDQSESFDAVILSCGSEASVKDPKPFRCYRILRELGHTVYDPLPVLVPLFGSEGFEKEWAGIRIRAELDHRGFTERGELQLTERGISGIPVFQISHGVIAEIQAEGKAEVFLDFLPDFSAETLKDKLISRAGAPGCRDEKVRELLKGWLPGKLIGPVLKRARVSAGTPAGELDEGQADSLITSIKHFGYSLTGFGSMAEAQAASGGLSLTELTGRFESRLVPGLFVTGELLDADGLCGGYNLHFAFGSGLIAGHAAAGKGAEHDRK